MAFNGTQIHFQKVTALPGNVLHFNTNEADVMQSSSDYNRKNLNAINFPVVLDILLLYKEIV